MTIPLIEKNHHLEGRYLEEVKSTVRERIARGDFAGDDPVMISAKDRAKKMFDKGVLSEKVLVKAVDEGDNAFVRYSLAFMSELPMEAVQKMLNGNSAKAVTALSWKAKLSMDVAEVLQIKIARIKPQSILRPDLEGDYPMSPEDMDWYLNFYL